MQALSDVAEYYSRRAQSFGATPQGVDWNSREGQWRRFAQLAKLIDLREPFSVNDLGCGYGAMLAFLEERHAGVRYTGYDIASDMLVLARTAHAGRPDTDFVLGARPDREADFALASGIFNVRLSCDDALWTSHLLSTLDDLFASCRRGMAFNCLTRFADADKMRSDLYYADPSLLLDHCLTRYSRKLALLHDYGLYEFTILVSKV